LVWDTLVCGVSCKGGAVNQGTASLTCDKALGTLNPDVTKKPFCSQITVS
jgi:hypothetical protein